MSMKARITNSSAVRRGSKFAIAPEEFDNDGSVIASIVKNLKRVMAAEFSRELSVKVHAGACRVASLGFKQGGAIGYGLRRELVDENRCSRGILGKGQRKHLQTEPGLGPARLAPRATNRRPNFSGVRGSPQDLKRHRAPAHNEQVPNHRGTPWSEAMIRNILGNEAYIGTASISQVVPAQAGHEEEPAGAMGQAYGPVRTNC